MSRTARSKNATKIDRRGSRAPARAEPRGKTSARTTKSRAAPDLPDWAVKHVFEQSKTVAWEGTANPLELTRLAPSISFIQQLLGPDAQPAAWSGIIHPIDRGRVAHFFAAPPAVPSSIDYRVVDSHGSVQWVRHSILGSEGSASQPRIHGFISDIQAEKEYQLESLRVSEREQNRIGQDLHDDLCQVLAGVSCLMRVFEGRVAAKAPDEVGSLKELNDQIVDAMHRTRALTHGLFPGKIQIADIRGALLELASQVKARFKVDIRTQFVGRFPKHSSAQVIQIYRISQEAMSNAIKHGRATTIEVRLEALAHAMQLTIQDNGDGFSHSENATPGVGLNIMNYRAALLGGEISVANGEPRGVNVSLRYPFESHG